MFETTNPQLVVFLSDGLYFLGIGVLLLLGYWVLKSSRQKKENLQKVGAELERIFSDDQEETPSSSKKKDQDPSTLC